MNIAYFSSFLHLLFSFLLLRVVPVQFLFLADLVAFPVSLFLLLRDIVTEWYLVSAVERRRKSALQRLPESSQSTRNPQSESSARASDYGVSRRHKYDGSPSAESGIDASSSANEPANSAGAKIHDDEATANERTLLVERVKRGGVDIRRQLLGKALFLVVQILVFSMVLDFVYRPLLFPGDKLTIFRPGYVSHDTAKLHIRYPDGGQLEIRYKEVIAQDAPGGAEWGHASNAPWEAAGPYDSPTDATDFTATIALANLRPSTRYAAELHNRQPTLLSDTVLLGSIEFKTAPAPGSPTKYRFGTGSCIKPNFPYIPALSPDVYGFASLLGHSDGLDMIMFLGDFIYADLPFYFGSDPEDYRRLYRQVYMAESSRRLLRKVPMLHVYDDHEIMNNWHDQDSPPMGSAMTAYNEYNGHPNPSPPLPHRAYYNFTYGNIAFYAWDTRRYRTDWETEDGKHKTMLGEEQKNHFLQWLQDVNHTAAVKFVISSVPVTTGWTNIDSNHDTWRGYRAERAEILGVTQHVPNLIFLSGDRHEMAAVELESGNLEFSTSPVSQFTFPLIGKFKQNIEGERTLHFRRAGHVKYGILDVDTETNPDVPKISYSLYTTDEHGGRPPAWTYEARGVPWR